jgi:hypothetical protein
MTNKILSNNDYNLEKLKATLDALSKKIVANSALNDILAEANVAFKEFYSQIANPEFIPVHMKDHDTPRSIDYNKNFQAILNDITRIYKQLDSLAQAQIKSYNYGQVVNSEITHRANQLASTVLDLKILSDFTRGDVLVAGDDFKTLDQVDLDIATAAPKAEKMFSSGGMALKRSGNRSLVDANTTVEIFPTGPVSNGTSVNTTPTPGNVERFYEGLYYNFIGQARPEGGQFNIKFMMKSVNKDPFPDQSSTNISAEGFFVEIGADEATKKEARARMFDGNPDSFWECEYVYDVPTPLLDDLIDTGAVEDTSKENSGTKGVSTVIDFKKAEQAAQAFDSPGRDLSIEIVVSFPTTQVVNMIVVDPILFGVNAFPVIAEIACAVADQQFVPVDLGSSSFGRVLTTEVNKFLNTTEAGQLLAPSRTSYAGRGVFAFAAQSADKVRLRLRLESPVPSVYERYHILLVNQIDLSLNTKVTVKKGALRF